MRIAQGTVVRAAAGSVIGDDILHHHVGNS
jgi:hypothetical protein